jgi:hypothetical protein
MGENTLQSEISRDMVSMPTYMHSDAYRMLDHRQQIFVNCYLQTLDHIYAAEQMRLGKRPGPSAKKYLKDERVQQVIMERVQELEECTKLNAEYVRNYVHGVLEFCPTDYFLLVDDEFCIDPVAWRELPETIKRFVENVEIRKGRNGTLYTVKFVSKTAALALAAKYTLTHKVELTQTQLPWDQITGAADYNPGDEDEMEKQIRGLVPVHQPI